VIALNVTSRGCLYAAQAIIRLGPEAAPAVLEHLNDLLEQQDAAGPAASQPTAPGPPPQQLTEVDLCVLILGFLADESIAGEFDALGDRLTGKHRAIWEIAKGWYDQGGRTFHLPRPPRQSVVARINPAPPARTIRFPDDRPVGGIAIRDWGSTDYAAWRLLGQKGKATSEVSIPEGKEAKLVVGQAAPTFLQRILRRVGLRTKAPKPRSAVVDLPELEPDDIQMLDLSGYEVSNAGLANVERLTGLRALYLRGTGVRDGALAHVEPLVSLETLDLSRTPITDKGLKHLAPLKMLSGLDLSGTQITDAAVARLAKMTSLRPHARAIRTTWDKVGRVARPVRSRRDNDGLIAPVWRPLRRDSAASLVL
jgi:hypothetical protein